MGLARITCTCTIWRGSGSSFWWLKVNVINSPAAAPGAVATAAPEPDEESSLALMLPVVVGVGVGAVTLNIVRFPLSWPSGLVTDTFQIPAIRPSGTVPLNDVEMPLTPVNDMAVYPVFVRFTIGVVVVSKPVPVTVIAVALVLIPVDGVMLVTAGAAANVNWSDNPIVDVPLGVITVISTVPVPAGEVAVIDVSVGVPVIIPGVLSNFTAVTPVKPVPETVTRVPPTNGPDFGEIPVTAGTGYSTSVKI